MTPYPHSRFTQGTYLAACSWSVITPLSVNTFPDKNTNFISVLDGLLVLVKEYTSHTQMCNTMSFKDKPTNSGNTRLVLPIKHNRTYNYSLPWIFDWYNSSFSVKCLSSNLTLMKHSFTFELHFLTIFSSQWDTVYLNQLRTKLPVSKSCKWISCIRFL